MEGAAKWQLTYFVASIFTFFAYVYNTHEHLGTTDTSNTGNSIDSSSSNPGVSTNTRPPIENDPYEALGPVVQIAIFGSLVVAFLFLPMLSMWLMAMEARHLFSVSQEMSPATNQSRLDDKDDKATPTTPGKSSDGIAKSTTPTTDTTETVKSGIKRTAPSSISNKEDAHSEHGSSSTGKAKAGSQVDRKRTESNPLAVTSNKSTNVNSRKPSTT